MLLKIVMPGKRRFPGVVFFHVGAVYSEADAVVFVQGEVVFKGQPRLGGVVGHAAGEVP